ncbi:MAG: PP0621 family protein [Betaproteobacteria bacterium]|nr:PP0621 family protein [Betaproteobacteria bacterium]
MGRLILLALAVLILVWLLRRAFGGRQADAPAASGAPGELVACAHCGVLVPRSEARNAAGAQYCGEEHARLGPRQP